MHRTTDSIETRQADENRVSNSLAALAMTLLLVVAGLFLVQHLGQKARLEDCLLSGRLNCDRLVTEAGG